MLLNLHHGAGFISIGASELSAFAEVYVQDSGTGMTPQELKKVNSQDFYTTNGTSQEQGYGLGLMLCKEFLAKNDGHLRIESEKGKGEYIFFYAAIIIDPYLYRLL
ncbi:MAG: ATP-binding protein [Bacteroidota bacterium]